MSGFRPLLLAGLILSFAAAPLSAGDVPTLYASDGPDLVKAKQRLEAGDPTLTEVRDDVVKDADKLLSVPPYSVVNKAFTPPSGDKHDYMSLSPYWWPDPAKPDGLPYIRRDGEFNPDRAKYDLGPLEDMSKAVDTLSMAYFLTGQEKYAQKTAELIRTWFIDPSTRMNPNLKYAQSIPGYTELRPAGVIEGGRFRRVIDGVGLIAGSQHWTPDDDAAVRKWFGELMDYLLTSEQGKAEQAAPNNHGTWYAVQVGTYALFSGDRAKAEELIVPTFKRLVAAQVEPDGSQPEEMARTLSLHYHRYNALGLIELATLGERVGADLWNYRTDDGRGLRTALDYLLPYAVQEKEWTGKQISPPKYGDFVVVYRRAANAYGEPAYEAAVTKLREKDKRPMVDLLFPAK